METDLVLIWLLLLTTITLNIIIFINDPLKSSTSNTNKCFGIKCRDYSLYTFIILMTCDIFILIALSNTDPFTPYLPSFWYLVVGFFLLLIPILYFRTIKEVIPNRKINPPPESQLNKKTRTFLSFLLLTSYVALITLRYVRNPLPTQSLQPFLEKFFYNRFGGHIPGNIIPFILSFFSITAIPLSLYKFIQSKNYHPQDYNLPLAWKI